MLPPEIEEGNREYKCYFKNIKKDRFIELSTQMNWRLNEGNGICYYYIGVNDDGTIYDKLSKKEIKYSFQILTQLTKKNNSTITKREEKNDNDKLWFTFEIKRNILVKKFNEYHILLLGDTKTGKSTFLANLIKNKLDINGNGKNFTFNHKHELVSGETSSINYFHLYIDNNNYVFFDSPGNKKYNSTLLKIVQSVNYNLILYFPKFDSSIWEYEKLYFDYFKMIDIPIQSINLNSKDNIFPNINMKNLIKKDQVIEYIKSKIIVKDTIDEVNFVVLNTYFHSEQGILLSGYLKSGVINKNTILYWYLNEIIKIKVISISNVNSKVDKITAPKLIVVKIKIINNNFTLNIKNLKYGFVTDKKYKIVESIKIKWNKELDNKNELVCNSNNDKIILKLQDNNFYKSCNHFKFRNNLLKNNIICLNYKCIGTINYLK